VSIDYSRLEPGRYRVTDDGRAIKMKSRTKPQVLQGWCCHYGVEHTNFKTGLREIFLPGVFADSLTGLLFLKDHALSEKAMATQDDGEIEVHDSEQGLAIRINVKDGMLDKLEGRDQFSVGYHVLESSIRSDGVRLIKKAVLIEVSSVDFGAVVQTYSQIRDSDDIGPLETDSKNWAYTGASLAFTRALRKLMDA
jgi:phage head maturation protease